MELEQLQGFDSFKDEGKGAPVPEGYTLIPCHFVYDVKHNGRKKSRFVAGGEKIAATLGLGVLRGASRERGGFGKSGGLCGRRTL